MRSTIARCLLALSCVSVLGLQRVHSQVDRCAIYAAAIAFASDTGRTVVLDSTSTAVPGFAFSAYTTYGNNLASQGLPLSDSVRQALVTANAHRGSVLDCIAPLTSVIPVTGDSLFALFKGGLDGWNRFHARYPGVKRFALVSQPLLLPDSTALVYFAYAAGLLNGSGGLLLLRRDANGHWVHKAHGYLWVS